MTDKRLELLNQWVKQTLNIEKYAIAPASADASFRRYFRIEYSGQTRIVMDAPPDKENCEPYIRIARAFYELGLHVPQIYAEDQTQGFLLLSDLGNDVYLRHLNDNSVDKLYGDATHALFTLQCKSMDRLTELPPYDQALLWREMELFREWFLEKHLGVTLTKKHHETLDKQFEALAHMALAQPKAWVHRDYHSRNLMLVQDNNPGILDFQDAVSGPITYDLVSLLRDCYIAWPRSRVEAWVEDYRLKLLEGKWFKVTDREQFLHWFDWMGVQRHLKAIGIFARLNHRDGKPGYLGDIPRTLNYVIEVVRTYPELVPLYRLIQELVLPKLNPENGHKL